MVYDRVSLKDNCTSPCYPRAGGAREQALHQLGFISEEYVVGSSANGAFPFLFLVLVPGGMQWAPHCPDFHLFSPSALWRWN